jgi:hypothetical protein
MEIANNPLAMFRMIVTRAIVLGLCHLMCGGGFAPPKGSF